jgi:hypothetical protein
MLWPNEAQKITNISPDGNFALRALSRCPQRPIASFFGQKLVECH